MQLEIEGIDYTNTLGPWIGKTYKMLDCYMESVLLENGIEISKQQWLILNLVNNNKGISQNELARFANRDKTSVTRFISNLESKAYLKRESSKKDKRVKNLYLTDLGLKTLKKTTPIVRKAVLKLQNELSKDEIKFAISSLKKIQDKITQIKSK
ncbi:MAG: MarR family winged helix-turn-helix transcriptional regulator [Chitinophagales bacterium]